MTGRPGVHRACSIEPEVYEHAADLLRVLAHPVRLQICLLLETGALRVGAVARAIGLRHNVASQLSASSARVA